MFSKKGMGESFLRGVSVETLNNVELVAFKRFHEEQLRRTMVQIGARARWLTEQMSLSWLEEMTQFRADIHKAQGKLFDSGSINLGEEVKVLG